MWPIHGKTSGHIHPSLSRQSIQGSFLLKVSILLQGFGRSIGVTPDVIDVSLHFGLRVKLQNSAVLRVSWDSWSLLWVDGRWQALCVYEWFFWRNRSLYEISINLTHNGLNAWPNYFCLDARSGVVFRAVTTVNLRGTIKKAWIEASHCCELEKAKKMNRFMPNCFLHRLLQSCRRPTTTFTCKDTREWLPWTFRRRDTCHLRRVSRSDLENSIVWLGDFRENPQ